MTPAGSTKFMAQLVTWPGDSGHDSLCLHHR